MASACRSGGEGACGVATRWPLARGRWAEGPVGVCRVINTARCAESCVNLLSRTSCTVVRGVAIEACRFGPRNRGWTFERGREHTAWLSGAAAARMGVFVQVFARTKLARVVRCMYFEPWNAA